MSAFFSSLSYSWFWLILGILIGWLLSYLFSKRSVKTPISKPTKTETPPTSKLANITNSETITPTATPATLTATPVAKTKLATPPAPKSVANEIDITAAKAAGFSLKNAHDLTIIEGIGPKINDLLIENGIKTFAALAEKTVPQLRATLDKGGARFRIANPATWAKQAELASVNKWNDLKKLQGELSGGVKKKS